MDDQKQTEPGAQPQSQPQTWQSTPSPGYQPGAGNVTVEYTTPTMQRRSHKKLWLLTLVVLCLAAIGSAAFFFRTTPDGVFNDYLAQSLQTKSFTQKFTQGNSTMSITYDLSNVRDPKVSTKIHTDNGSGG